MRLLMELSYELEEINVLQKLESLIGHGEEVCIFCLNSSIGRRLLVSLQLHNRAITSWLMRVLVHASATERTE
ncbi:hypothetical protein GIB67_021824 [Kingdonia uniflora]|uniref:Uncharacterized protein n=1 Tax=Kingdonia uniflora TaxID=39325 RepID=A0A7J7P7B4_9MAGN|nr:hypothetical protein GIB67_021824 [Kingdonia uniflora]